MSQTTKCRGVRTETFYDATTGFIGVAYRGTLVAQRSGRMVTLNTGGWWTVTTKLRMNQFANEFCDSQFQVYQKAGKWFVRVGRHMYTEIVPYVENIIIFELGSAPQCSNHAIRHAALQGAD